MASAPKKSDPTVPIIVVLAAVLLLVLFGGSCGGIPRITWNGGPDQVQNAGAPGGPDRRGGALDRGDRGGSPRDRGFRGDRGCGGRGPGRCAIHAGHGRRGLDDRGRLGCGCERGRHRAGERTDRRRDRGRDLGWDWPG